MGNLDSLKMVHQGSEASAEYLERLRQANQHEAEKLHELDQENGAPVSLQWRDGKNKQMNDFIARLEQSSIQRTKFGVSH